MGFREDYAKFDQPSRDRENFVYKAVTSLPTSQITGSMKPITVSKPDGTKVTYKVMPDYLMVDGMRVPMSGITAQKVADHFGLSLPTAAIAKEIYQNADVKVTANPLSGSGAKVDGKNYSGSEVVGKGVGYAPFAVHYNDKINQQLSDKGAGDGQIVSGFAKDIVAPAAPGKLGLYGLFDAKGNPIQGGNGQTPHETATHTEYGSFVRLISPEVTVTHPDGKQEIKPINEVYQIARYTPAPKKTDAVEPAATDNKQEVAQYTPNKPQSGRSQILNRIDQFLSQFKT